MHLVFPLPLWTPHSTAVTVEAAVATFPSLTAPEPVVRGGRRKSEALQMQLMSFHPAALLWQVSPILKRCSARSTPPL
jgi:hypothetical protein